MGNRLETIGKAHRFSRSGSPNLQKGHSWRATVALLQTRLGLFRPVFELKSVSTKFKRLVVCVLDKLPNLRIYTRVDNPLRISQAERLKTNK